jgi:hypothetical protein
MVSKPKELRYEILFGNGLPVGLLPCFRRIEKAFM